MMAKAVSSSSLKNRFDYGHSVKNDELEKKRAALQSLSTPEQTSVNCFQTVRRHFWAVSIVLMGILYAWFANYPQPPIAPILYQWRSMSQTFLYKGYTIYYFDKTFDRNDTHQTLESNILLYLHGFPTSSFDLFKLVKPLGERRFDRIIAPDLIGFGFSDKPRFYSYSIKDQTKLVIALIEHLGLSKLDHQVEIHLLVHDYSVSIAQEMLALNKNGELPFKMRSLCMLNGGIFPSRHKPVLMQKLLRIPMVSNVLSRFSNYLFFSHSLTQVFGPQTKPTASELSDFWKLVRLNDGYLIWSSLLSYIDERFANEDRWIDALRRPSVPLHFIYGIADPVNPPPFDQIYREIVYKPSIDVLQNIGHYPQVEAPDLVVESYFKFLNRCCQKFSSPQSS